jgi:hypothetical protein
MTKYITEILDELNKDPAKIAQYKDAFVVKTVFQYAYNPELKFKLPPGAPPFKPDPAPMGMSPANFYQQVKKLYIFMREDITNVRREQLFIQLLEGLNPAEAAIVIAIKDQDLTPLYPNLTRQFAVDAGFVAPLVEEVKQDSKSEEGKSLVLNLSDTTITKESFGKPKDVVDQTTTQTPPVKSGRGRPRKNPATK